MEIENGTPTILGDATQVHQIIMNLAANSAHALPDNGGLIEVSVRPAEVDEEMARGHADLQPGIYAVLSVRDTGHGIEAAIQQRIFDPFFTTKAPGLGTGLGLAVVHGIVRKHRGMIRVNSDPGQGTDIQIYFPATDRPAPESPAGPGRLAAGNGKRVLFVDDEVALAKVGCLMLTRMGFEVEMQTGSLDAWEAFAAAPDRFDLVITDQTMPKLTGLELAGRMLQLRPGLPIILVTGYHASASRERVHQAGIAEMVMKPYTIDSLGKVIHQVMQDGRSRSAAS
jgi:CheY-like chemotaxis protein